MHMSYKTISVPTEVYDLLSSMKGANESFGAFFRKMLARKKGRIGDYCGAWKMSDAEEGRLRKAINKQWGNWDEGAGH